MYSVLNDTLNGRVDLGQLNQEVTDSDISVNLLRIGVTGDSIVFEFEGGLSESDLSNEDTVILASIISLHTFSVSFSEERELTNQRNIDGFDTYKDIFAHISDNQPITNIDGFIVTSDVLHKLRNFLKDGNFETCVRYMYRFIKPEMENPTSVLYGLDFEVYRGWVNDLAIRYNPALSYNSELINPAFVGTPFEGVPFINYIELAPEGQV